VLSSFNITNRANFGNQYFGNAFSPAPYHQPNSHLGGCGARLDATEFVSGAVRRAIPILMCFHLRWRAKAPGARRRVLAQVWSRAARGLLPRV
jgi:hypothetical protein